MTFSTIDQEMMALALQEARRATMETSPNPKVGCVLLKGGEIIGQGHTQKVGQAHAEVMALRDAVNKGHDVSGATAYVTLEPCSHYGRTPPCANALIEARVARVVAAIEDANPQVAGRGFAMLRDAGIEVAHGLMAAEAREMNIGFLRRMETGKPWVRLKMAASLDGFTALPNGHSQWITDSEARVDGHRWRSRADAILTGIGTVLVDDPQMTVRLPGQEISRQPRKVIADSMLRTPENAQLLQSGETTLVHTQATLLPESKMGRLREKGVQLLELPGADGSGVDLNALVLELGRQQVNELHVEAGASLSGALMAAGVVDELLLYLAPKFLGAGKTMFELPTLSDVNQAMAWQVHEMKPIGNSIRVLLRK
ncbi:bifunctional diaminohydroxyphosphoribosylaminopyrimidine deaminase/5-amino-6-(5-phosphoribosylamino)uracil reductase RibD [Undibacterium sp. LX40W]|uniref:Riboflavin biosynthesis protein RibD n=1 Tax=Undibacterium nitidum TaxID=2762298 RepID=A0A923HTE7_9BURK|nr:MULTISPECIES: bifunctional diaminohydroxyphosphoribosylaminopyrimidine deaminase/5-amino-6-(5-phosphoribosylamino)uracil reductase RibD [Undibacterium]MBC3880854.1 bifunctional diaminohydroxyphosphoribosylaminopyrimidine deaminase/5-amino-6-(5-phosphoribosylamino)uracil reductase RibD [Undibacterium nitidum]MBC3890413.1 bifunctional diaminohydroxyphosphoribosylaminopyrimidine deaminase/5-amino-6-(5-phosphoribosylamino)uracil reductase RibD [Undibacterium sp. LX40W]